MYLTILKSKIHRAQVTEADLSYEGSISIDPVICDAAQLRPYEKVEIYNCNNGARFSTYVIYGKPAEICLNGAAARQALPGDIVIICSFVMINQSEYEQHQPVNVFIGEKKNSIKAIK